MNDKEKIIKDQRTIEASRKGLMGLGGKLGCVLKNLGQPIVSQHEGGLLYHSTSLEDYTNVEVEDPYDLSGGTPEEILDQIEVMDMENTTIISLGWVFDGLFCGMHLEIQYTTETNEIKVHFKGHLVYNEVGGELLAYNPIKEWEDYIETLYPVALAKGTAKKAIKREEKKEAGKKAKKSWLREMAKKWGI